jgi:putative transferase (TIGR04331 family)
MKSKFKDLNCDQTFSNGDLSKYGVVLEKKEILSLSENLSHVYFELTDELSLRYHKKYNISQDALKILLRPAIVTLSHCFFERLIRINKIISTSKYKFSVAHGDLLPVFNVYEEINSAILTQKYNQSVISFISQVWLLQKVVGDEIVELNIERLPVNFKNNLFKISKSRFTIANLSAYFYKLFFLLPTFGRFPVLNFSSSIHSLHKHFFYILNFREVNKIFLKKDLSLDFELRREIFDEKYLKSKEINIFLSKYSFSKKQKTFISKLFIIFLKESFSLQFVEGFHDNFHSARNALSTYTTKALLFSSLSDTKSLFMLCAAKTMKFRLINFQHGGHYGYLKDNSAALECEYPLSDQFLTWGWKILPEHPAITHLAIKSLPSAWLSERKNYWKNFLIFDDKPFDIIWMPCKTHRFTRAPQGISSNRFDVINQYSLSMIDFLTKAVKSQFRVYCKPCDYASFTLIANTYKSMESIGGEFFECTDKFNKGLSADLLEKGKLFLWDQPGTGFLECLACGIPTMLLWTRLFCEEEDWCKKDFRELEKAGIIHRTTQGLIKELKIFLSDPALWMNDSKRKLTVQSFTYKYALTDDQWWKTWRTYLKQLKNEVNEKY